MSATHYSWRGAKKPQCLNKSCETSVKKYEGWLAKGGYRAAGGRYL